MYPKKYITEDGIITDRNGTWNLTAVEITEFDDKARIDGFGQRGTVIRGGLSFDKSTMDEIARDWLKSRGYFTEGLWHIDDIKIYAEQELGIDHLTHKDYDNIRKEIERNMDATIGITWDTIEYRIESYINKSIQS